MTTIRLTTIQTMNASRRQRALAEAFLAAHGATGARVNIFTANGYVTVDVPRTSRAWGRFVTKYRTLILDWATAALTAFESFSEMLHAKGGYRPSMRLDMDWRFLPLADAYDQAQTDRCDSRRAARYPAIA